MAPKKKILPKRQPWNKGLKVGKRDGFAPDQVKRIRGLLADRGVPGLKVLALFSAAIDTMLHGQDLLNLVVGDVQSRNGSIRPVIEIARERGMPPVRCALSKTSTMALEKWISASGQKRTDYLFPGRGAQGGRRDHGNGEGDKDIGVRHPILGPIGETKSKTRKRALTGIIDWCLIGTTCAGRRQIVDARHYRPSCRQYIGLARISQAA